MVKQAIVVLGLTSAFMLVMCHASDARTHRHHRHHVRHHHHPVDANGNLATVITSIGLTARVASSAREQFQKFIDAVELDGNKITDIGCFATHGHMRHSKHYRGLACDVMQQSRNVTAAFMYHVTEIAHQFGLEDGCEWHRKDCGHIEIPGPTVTVSARHHRHHRMATR